MGKSDLRREITTYTAPRGRFQLVVVSPARYLALDGRGDPNSAPAYRDALATLYPVAYRLKFTSKTVLDRDYTVMPLEALWWSDDMDTFTTARDKSRWHWRLLNLVPSWLGAEDVAAARRTVARSGHAPLVDALRYEPLDEGLVVQTLHVGPYDDEGPVLAAMHEHVAAEGYALSGRHHEVYLSDPRRTAPARLRTILRQPVARD
ncbi:GyrI-like domain-containing protein [Microlunatus flavus]|uniref:GyrI-like small molecule binding domain-containing protein n=1 Tax=Microlunatus flavus TaxID=1036181 RepID=A0A1H9GVZ5_9ACTN|nr:GyrI-like domain-containing protein [Microlunatus flavus]SEQ54163.1 hypothetical protein SAMN05421756_10422 [Microlunatus flavus]